MTPEINRAASFFATLFEHYALQLPPVIPVPVFLISVDKIPFELPRPSIRSSYWEDLKLTMRMQGLDVGRVGADDAPAVVIAQGEIPFVTCYMPMAKWAVLIRDHNAAKHAAANIEAETLMKKLMTS